MTNPTALKFGYPRTMVAESDHWIVMVRPQQPTFGSLTLVCKESANAFSELSAAAFADMGPMVRGIEALLEDAVAYERINYLMLMMVDPDVHFHVIPRYDGERTHAGLKFSDTGWPGPPALSPAISLTEAQQQSLAANFAFRWTGPGGAR